MDSFWELKIAISLNSQIFVSTADALVVITVSNLRGTHPLHLTFCAEAHEAIFQLDANPITIDIGIQVTV